MDDDIEDKVDTAAADIIRTSEHIFKSSLSQFKNHIKHTPPVESVYKDLKQKNNSRSLPETSFGRDYCVIVTCTSVTRIFPPYSSWLLTRPASIATYCGNTAIFTQTQNWLFTLGRNVRHLLLRHTLLWSCQVELVRPLCVRKPLVRRGSSAMGEGQTKQGSSGQPGLTGPGGRHRARPGTSDTAHAQRGVMRSNHWSGHYQEKSRVRAGVIV